VLITLHINNIMSHLNYIKIFYTIFFLSRVH